MRVVLTIVALLAASAAESSQVSLSRHFDCIKQAATQQTILTFSRNQGNDVSFDEIEASENYTVTWGRSFGERLGALQKSEQDTWLQQVNELNSTLPNQIRLIVQKNGHKKALEIVDQRMLECRSELDQ